MWNVNKSFLVHIVLAHSYLVYFASLLFGLAIDVYWPIRIDIPGLEILGTLLIFAGPLLIFWAQNTSHKMAVKQICSREGVCVDDFYKGPYTFTRSPTHLGIFLMVIGFGFIMCSISIILTTTIAFILTRYVFVKKEERILEDKYGEPYRLYKTRVKF